MGSQFAPGVLEIDDMKEQEIMNGTADGLCPTLRANYFKMGAANFVGRDKSEDGLSAPCVIEKEDMKEQKLINELKDGTCPTVLASYHKKGGADLTREKYGHPFVMDIVNGDSDGNARTIVARYGQKGKSSIARNDGLGMTGVIEKDLVIAASRGRGEGWQQTLEFNTEGKSNTITTSLKDNLVIEQRKEPIKIGEKYGRLVVLEKTTEKCGTSYLYKCKCDCGKICLVPSCRLGVTTFSCGCYKIECHRTHNESNTRLYNIWSNMKKRCYNINCPKYKIYGGRGISVCDEWRDSYIKFKEWACTNGYSDDLSIDRIDNNGNYEPSNCRWVDNSIQMRNRNPIGEIPYDGIVRDSTGYRAQISVDGKKIYIAHSVNDIEYLVKKRNEYIISHNLDFKIQEFKGGFMNNKNKEDRDINFDSLRKKGELRVENGCLVDNEGYRYRIRKLTPRECFRLQDVKDADIDTIAAYRCDEDGFLCDAHGEPVLNIEFTEPKKNERKVTVEVNGEEREYYKSQLLWTRRGDAISRSAQYKLAGNSICVAPMYHTFRKLFIEPENENQQLELF